MDKEESSLGDMGEDHGTCEELGMRHGRPSFTLSIRKVERKPIREIEVVDGKEGVGGGHSTEECKDNTTLQREGPLLCSQVLAEAWRRVKRNKGSGE